MICMPDTDLSSQTITFAQLERVLTSFGFLRQETEHLIAFREGTHDALIILPVIRAEQLVDDAHLVAVRNSVTGTGIASEAQFRSRLLAASSDASQSRELVPASG